MKRCNQELLQTLWELSVPSSGPPGTIKYNYCDGLITLSGPQPESTPSTQSLYPRAVQAVSIHP